MVTSLRIAGRTAAMVAAGALALAIVYGLIALLALFS